MSKPFKHVPSKRTDLLGPIDGREPFVYREQEPTQGGTPPKASASFHLRVENLSNLATTARAQIRKPSAKLTQREREHMHTFAFSSEQVLRSPHVKKHGGRS